MAIVPNNESLNAPVISGILTRHLDKFKTSMDSLLVDGPSFTIDLEPKKDPCPNSCRYNPTYKQYMDDDGGLCRECRGKGYKYEQRQTIYKCNRRWTNEPLDLNKHGGEKTPGGRVYENYVRIKTVIESYDHILEAIGGTIDGIKVKLYREPRKTGLGDVQLYVVSWWERVNQGE